jgi:hypothetical protein
MDELLLGTPYVSLSNIEVALVLLAAYLHDIGMTPHGHRARMHLRYIKSGDRGGLTATEIDELQSWLDAEQQGVEPPITSDVTAPSDLSPSDEVFAYYLRHRHNDWSEYWIKENLTDLSPSSVLGLGR